MSEPMKAIVVRQPWATLIALGIKTIETRPAPPNGPMRPAGVRGLPGRTLERGERIAIVAGAQKPKRRHETHWGNLDDDTDPLIEANEAPWLWMEYDDGTGGCWGWWGGPLGAVVCTAVVADALPIIPCEPYDYPLTRRDGNRAERAAWAEEWDVLRNGATYIGTGGLDGGPWLVYGVGQSGSAARMHDQLPLGDFTPGRWGWMLTDPRPCEPIPCKGRQGVFELPADVAGTIA